METAGRWSAAAVAALGLCVVTSVLISGSTGIVCRTAVESLDLGCLLRWDCPHASPNTTYTVQTKTQGDPWRDVSWCVWVSSRSCDVSGAFHDFQLYNMIRLGVHARPGSTVWMQPRKFDYSDFTFSPPSVSVSLEEERLLVKVQFPCAVNRRCSLEGCCPVTELIDPWTTITVYNKLNRSEYQSRTVWSQEVVAHVEFTGLAPGQNYCAVANFSFPTFSMAASPKSEPQCVQTVSKTGLLPLLCSGLGLSSLLAIPVLAVLLRKPRRAAPATGSCAEPKAPTLIPDPVSSAPVDPSDVHLELVEDHQSIKSASSSLSPNNHDRTSTLVDVYASDFFHREPGTPYWDSGGAGLDSGICIPPASHSSDETCRANGETS